MNVHHFFDLNFFLVRQVQRAMTGSRENSPLPSPSLQKPKPRVKPVSDPRRKPNQQPVRNLKQEKPPSPKLTESERRAKRAAEMASFLSRDSPPPTPESMHNTPPGSPKASPKMTSFNSPEPPRTPEIYDNTMKNVEMDTDIFMDDTEIIMSSGKHKPEIIDVEKHKPKPVFQLDAGILDILKQHTKSGKFIQDDVVEVRPPTPPTLDEVIPQHAQAKLYHVSFLFFSIVFPVQNIKSK